MNSGGAKAAGPDRVGLCTTCRWVDVVRSSKGSTFYRCTLAEVNAAFRRYPVLPVRSCSGYERERSGPER